MVTELWAEDCQLAQYPFGIRRLTMRYEQRMNLFSHNASECPSSPRKLLMSPVLVSIPGERSGPDRMGG